MGMAACQFLIPNTGPSPFPQKPANILPRYPNWQPELRFIPDRSSKYFIVTQHTLEAVNMQGQAERLFFPNADPVVSGTLEGENLLLPPDLTAEGASTANDQSAQPPGG